MSNPTEDEKPLIELTRGALLEVLGREPTRQELGKAHAGFKRMAFMLLDHMDHIKKHENENPDQTTLREDIETDIEETADKKRIVGEEGESLE